MTAKLIEDIPAPGATKVAVAIGRFNPPTRGHYELFTRLKQYALKSDGKVDKIPVVVVIGGGKSDHNVKKNPLSVKDRIRFMQASGRADAIRFLHAANAMDAFKIVREAGFEPFAVAAGDDRAPAYKRILDNYFLDSNNAVQPHEVISLDRDDDSVNPADEDMDKLLQRMQDGEEIDIDDVSASLARHAVEMDYFPEFADLVGLTYKKELAKIMFNKIKKAFEAAEETE